MLYFWFKFIEEKDCDNGLCLRGVAAVVAVVVSPLLLLKELKKLLLFLSCKFEMEEERNILNIY